MMENKKSSDVFFSRKARWTVIISMLILLLLGATILSLNIGTTQIAPLKILEIILNKIPLINTGVHYDIAPVDEAIIIQIRLPRIVAALMVGATLATAGTVFQGIFRNPMADPYIIGVSAGAALGASVAIVLGVGYSLLGAAAISIFAFFFAFLSIFIVYNVARVGSKVPITTLLLSGIALSIFLSAIVSFIQVIAGEKLHAITFWLMGGFSYAEWGSILAVLPSLAIGMFVISIYARDLNIMQMGEETAQHLGVETERVKKILLIFGSLITASAVSISGLIGFVGLIIPHLMRVVIGPDHRILIPSSLIAGAIFLVSCDAAARTIFLPIEIPVGIITAFTGGPFFIYLLRRKKEKYSV